MVSRVNLPPVPAVDTSTDKNNRRHDEQSVQKKPGTSGRLPSLKGERGKLMAHIKRGERASGARSKKESTARTGNAGFAAAYELIEAFGNGKLTGDVLRHLEEMIRLQTPPQTLKATEVVTGLINFLRSSGWPGQENGNAGARDTPVPGVEYRPANEAGKPEGR